MKKIFFAGFILLAFIALGCKTSLQLARIEPDSRIFSESKTYQTDQKVEKIIAPYKKEVETKMNKIIGQAAFQLVKAAPESTLGNFCADAIHRKAEEYSGEKIDFAIQNYGGIRIDYLAEGDISLGRIYELMPFENRLVILDVPGDITLKFIEHMTRRGGWPVSSTLRYFISEGKPVEITINGKSLESSQIYKIALPDYIANGGDKCDYLADLPRTDTGKLIRDAFIETISESGQAKETIAPKIDGRVAVRNN